VKSHEPCLYEAYRSVIGTFLTITENYHSGSAKLKEELCEKESELRQRHQANLARIREHCTEEKVKADQSYRDELERLDADEEREISRVRDELCRTRAKARAMLAASKAQIEKACSLLRKARLEHLSVSLEKEASLPEEARPPIHVHTRALPRLQPRGGRSLVDDPEFDVFRHEKLENSPITAGLFENVQESLREGDDKNDPLCQPDNPPSNWKHKES